MALYYFTVKHFWKITFAIGIPLLILQNYLAFSGRLREVLPMEFLILAPVSILPIIVLAIGGTKRYQALAIDPQKVIFQENQSSGCSQRDFITQLGGAARCLVIAVGDGSLFVGPMLFMAAFGDVLDLLHRVEVSSLTLVERKAGGVVLVTWNEAEEARALKLRPKDVDGFLRALEAKGLSRNRVHAVPV